MAALAKNTIFTNVALTPDGGVWWEGMTDEPPGECHRLAGQRLDARASRRRRARRRRIRTRASPRRRRNARRSIPTGKTRRACRSARSSSAAAAPRRCRWSTRRSTGAAASTSGATMGSEMTAAAAGTVGKVRRDPMAMLPFCGYHMGDYFRHWISMQRNALRDAAHLPRELVPQGRGRQVHLARVSARTCAC